MFSRGHGACPGRQGRESLEVPRRRTRRTTKIRACPAQKLDQTNQGTLARRSFGRFRTNDTNCYSQFTPTARRDQTPPRLTETDHREPEFVPGPPHEIRFPERNGTDEPTRVRRSIRILEKNPARLPFRRITPRRKIACDVRCVPPPVPQRTVETAPTETKDSRGRQNHTASHGAPHSRSRTETVATIAFDRIASGRCNGFVLYSIK